MDENEKEEETMAEGGRASQELYLHRRVSEIISDIKKILLNPNLLKEDEIWIRKTIQDALEEDEEEEK